MNAPTYKVPVLVCQMVRERSVSLAVDVADSSRAAIELARAMIGDKPQEHFLAIFTNGQCAIVGVTIVAIGQAAKAGVAPRDVFRPALACGAIIPQATPSRAPTT